MKKISIVSIGMLIVTALMLSGCILVPVSDGDGGGHRGGSHGDGGHRDGGDRR